jgi:hypothetical protein
MATVLEECSTEEQSSFMRLLWEKALNAKDINKEMFPVYVGKYLSRKEVYNWVANVSLMTKRLKRRCGSRLLCCEFRRTGKEMGQSINVGGGYIEK